MMSRKPNKTCVIVIVLILVAANFKVFSTLDRLIIGYKLFVYYFITSWDIVIFSLCYQLIRGNLNLVHRYSQ